MVVWVSIYGGGDEPLPVAGHLGDGEPIVKPTLEGRFNVFLAGDAYWDMKNSRASLWTGWLHESSTELTRKRPGMVCFHM